MQTPTKPINIPAELPFLQAICWQTKDVKHFTLDEMLNRYERGWIHRGVLADIEGEELEFVRLLAKTKGSFLIANV